MKLDETADCRGQHQRTPISDGFILVPGRRNGNVASAMEKLLVLLREAEMSERIYQDVKANVWVQPVRCGYKMACCDCYLVHQLDFRIHKNRVQMRIRRDSRATAQLRRFRGGQYG